MPIASSQIISKRVQRNGQIKVHEVFVDSLGKEHRHFYVASPGTSDAEINTRLVDRIPHRNDRLKKQEIRKYLTQIEQGKNVVSLDYEETTQSERAIEFLKWAKDKAIEGDHQALRHAVVLIDQFTETQIDNLLGVGKGVKVKAWAEKLRDMATAMDESTTAAEGI